ncbi:DNA helicase [Bacillus coahuilensis p1.1.43]|uniref:DNA helicase n=1 Tax=Bacillus coahuilensis p1.1.43 TaxID=1150625 RepID=A0A147KB01_9BACI|nr:UvrD-helicase domain-containing protein [Bacillus coahuilensis]KUP08064.1 DNA helicase [Bacillus coahuilensis p1.1.43]
MEKQPLHPEFQQEANRLEFTKRYIDAVIKTAQTSKDQFKQNMKEAFGDEDFIESSAAYTDLIANASFFDMSQDEVNALIKARNKPYFARINYKREESANHEKHYIGKTSLYQRENQEQIIVDWRSPIANLYYEGRIGKESYQAEGETFHGELTLKRQYMIEKGNLEEIRDIDLTTMDELLQDSLAKSSSNRLTEIISTIQEEQNQIIRADLNKPIIVQGAAGSGKTTIALHRISYFIYQYKQYFDPSQLMILAPSHLFIDYISEALPELGVERIRQTTFSDYALTCIEKTLRIRKDDKLMNLVENQTEASLVAADVARFKGSREMKRTLDRYIQHIFLRFQTKDDFYIDKYRLYAANRFNKLLIEEYHYLPLYKRIDKLKGILQGTVKNNRQLMLQKVERFFDDKIEKALFRKESPERREYVTKALDKKEERIVQLKKEIRNGVNSYFKQFEKKNVLNYYKELYSNPTMLVELSNEELTMQEAEMICDYSNRQFTSGRVEVEDLPALLYLQTHLFGVDKQHRAKNVVIDEAQDYSYMQIQSLKSALDTDMFTLVGDLAQGIHSYRSISSWEPLLKEIFPRATYKELQKSYRTTVEIMNEANKLLEKLPNTFPKVTPVVRYGETPTYDQITSDFQGHLWERLLRYKEDGLQTFAIIGKTANECEKIADEMSDRKDEFVMLKENERIPKDKVVIVPSYLSKGLEFDVVFLVSIDEQFKESNVLDIKLQYVAMTRPLHRLHLYSKNKDAFIK